MILLRECRQERSLSVEAIADTLNLTTTDLEKAESGRKPFDFSVLHRACDFMQVPVSRLIYIAECYARALKYEGWDILYTAPQKHDRDNLFEMAQAFWRTPLGQGSFRGFAVIDEPNVFGGIAAPIFRYVLDPVFRALQDNAAGLKLDLSFPVEAEEGLGSS